MLSAAFIVGVPLFAEAFGYAGYPQAYGGAPHVFAPYTYVNNYPYGNAGTYQYPMQASSYSYTYPSYMYSYPQYQTGYSQSGYYQPNYQPVSYSPNYGYGGYPAYASSYMSGDEYCYSGYGCYPFYVADPHQWVYDYWTGTWY